MFGNAIGYVRVVDCTVGCAGVRSFPTWTFRDGSRLSGVASFDDLGSRTGCRFGQRRERPDDGGVMRETTSGGWHERYVGGARIIEVPRR
jgi:hypothetical protein